jgi:YVTN family beta-propeller protein
VPTASIAVVKPISLATDGTAVWALSETGSVARIDPATNASGASIQTGGTDGYYQGMSVDANSVWITEWNTASLYRVDRTTSTAVTIDVGLAPKGVLATGSAVWVADTHDGKVLRVDPATNTVVASITVGPAGNSGPNWLGSGLGSIWVGVPNASTVVRIDPITNAVQATIPTPVEVSPCGGFAFTETDVWAESCGGRPTVARIDPATNTVVGVIYQGGLAFTPVVIDGAAWVSVETPAIPGHLARLSPTEDAVDLALRPGPDFGGGGDLVLAAGAAWVMDVGHDRVLRLPLAGFPSD